MDRGELTFHIAREHLPLVARTLRDDPALRFELCLGVSGVHYPGDTGRELHAVYHLRSITHGRRLRLEVSAPDRDPHIPSLVAVYPTNDWHEREAYDFFGIVFDGHPALTRIMMPDDWQGHPQRKDYPLGGIPCRVQRRPDPGSGPAEVLLVTSYHAPEAEARETTEAPSTPSPAATGTRSPRPRRRPTTSGSSSTWAPSTPPRTGCSG